MGRSLTGQSLVGTAAAGHHDRPDTARQHHDQGLAKLNLLEEVRSRLLALAERERIHQLRLNGLDADELAALYGAAHDEDLGFVDWIEGRMKRDWPAAVERPKPLPEALGFQPDPEGAELFDMLAHDIVDQMDQLTILRRLAEESQGDVQLSLVMRSIISNIERRIEHMKAAHPQL